MKVRILMFILGLLLSGKSIATGGGVEPQEQSKNVVAILDACSLFPSMCEVSTLSGNGGGIEPPAKPKRNSN